jgi:hypothetical protein
MKRSIKIRIRHRGDPMLFCPAALPLSSQTLTYTAGVIRRHRRQIGSCWRKLSPGRQALLVLAFPQVSRHAAVRQYRRVAHRIADGPFQR